MPGHCSKHFFVPYCKQIVQDGGTERHERKDDTIISIEDSATEHFLKFTRSNIKEFLNPVKEDAITEHVVSETLNCEMAGVKCYVIYVD